MKRTRSRPGLTLVEVLVALAVAGVAFGALASLQAGALKAGRLARALLHGAELLQNEVVRQRVAPGSGGAAVAGCFTDPGPSYACHAERSCLPLLPDCQLVSFTVRLLPLGGTPGAELMVTGVASPPPPLTP